MGLSRPLQIPLFSLKLGSRKATFEIAVKRLEIDENVNRVHLVTQYVRSSNGLITIVIVPLISVVLVELCNIEQCVNMVCDLDLVIGRVGNFPTTAKLVTF